jgi:aspartate carbamoyltransferase regulatory subunit
MVIDAIFNGIVLDHIRAGRGMDLYQILKLDQLQCSVAVLKNVTSRKMGRKDIIKIDALIDMDFAVLGYVDPGITVSIVREGKLDRKFTVELPERVVNVIHCRNPRCITSTEQELPHIFKLADRENRVYRCLYCESRAKGKD